MKRNLFAYSPKRFLSVLNNVAYVNWLQFFLLDWVLVEPCRSIRASFHHAYVFKNDVFKELFPVFFLDVLLYGIAVIRMGKNQEEDLTI